MQGEVGAPTDRLRWRMALGWWNRRRAFYNLALVIAGVVAFGLYALAFELWAPRNDPEVEITVFTTLFQAFGYLVCIGIANAFFFLGPVGEQLIPSRVVNAYRRIAFGGGVAFSVLLPLTVPILFYLNYGIGSSPPISDLP